MTFNKWLKSKNACQPAMEWLGERTMRQAWDECERGEWLAWWLDRAGLDNSTLRLIACDMVRYTPLADGRTTWDLLTDERSRNAVEVAERYAHGKATDEERRAALDAAGDAARAAAGDAARAAAWDAAWVAALDAAWDAAWDAARVAAGDAAWNAARVAAGDAADKAQCDLIRKRVNWETAEELMSKQLTEVTV